MQNRKLTSGFVRNIRYNEQKQILDITGNDGTVYQYFEVPEAVHQEFFASEDPDGFYMKFIRNRFRRLFKAYDYSVMY
jgi:hypothetical protein